MFCRTPSRSISWPPTRRRLPTRNLTGPAGDAYRDEDLVFCDELGQRLSTTNVSAAFSRHRKKAGLTDTMHVLRHTATTLMLTNGIPLHVVASRIGDRPETVLKTYAHLLPQSNEQAAAAMADLLGAAR